MANDKKISELNPALLPLSGTELVPIVQNGETKFVPSAALIEKDFIEKSKQPFVSINASGNLTNFTLPDGYNFGLYGTILQVRSFNVVSATHLFPGKKITLKNFQSTPISFRDGQFSLFNFTNFTLNPFESIEFIYTANGSFEQIGIDNNKITAVPFNTFKFIQKGFGNTGPQNPAEEGDVYCGHSDDGLYIIQTALYRGVGSLNTHTNFKILSAVGREEIIL